MCNAQQAVTGRHPACMGLRSLKAVEYPCEAAGAAGIPLGTEVRRRSGCPRMIRRCSSAEFCYTNSCRFRVGMWRSLVARLLWEQDVAGSNPVHPDHFPSCTLLTSEIASIGCRWLTKACIKQQFTQLLQTFAPLSPATRDASRFEDRRKRSGRMRSSQPMRTNRNPRFPMAFCRCRSLSKTSA